MYPGSLSFSQIYGDMLAKANFSVSQMKNSAKLRLTPVAFKSVFSLSTYYFSRQLRFQAQLDRLNSLSVITFKAK